MDIWVIYYNPSDIPDKYVVRVQRVARGGVEMAPIARSFDTLTQARNYVLLSMVGQPGGGAPYRVARDPQDDPAIVECWI